MKNYLLKVGILDNIKQQVTEQDIDELKIYLGKDHRELIDFSIAADFLIYLPLIDWEKCEEINVFA